MANAEKIAARLLEKNPNPRLALSYSDPLQLLIAVILSAQCTDARVNQVTAKLFERYRTAKDFAEADPSALEDAIRPTGFYRNKARRLIDCCRRLVASHGGEVPPRLEDLVTLPGVGRKTANMVLGNAFGIPGIAVDTHVLRVANRLGLAHSEDADTVEESLMAELPRDLWVRFTNAMILHGRETCAARNPACGRCVLYAECGWPDKVRHPERLTENP
jgi:endonuclease-3